MVFFKLHHKLNKSLGSFIQLIENNLLKEWDFFSYSLFAQEHNKEGVIN